MRNHKRDEQRWPATGQATGQMAKRPEKMWDREAHKYGSVLVGSTDVYLGRRGAADSGPVLSI